MAYIYHNSKADGTPDSQLSSGQTDVLFSSITTAERIAGDSEFQKVWITDDEDSTTYVGQFYPSRYISTVFLSASDNDDETDLTGAEVRYGALQVASATETGIIVTENELYSLVRVGDNIVVENAPYEVETVTDNGDGTLTIVATIDFVAIPTANAWITSLLSLALVTATARPFWTEETLPAGSSWYGSAEPTSLMIGK